MLHILAPIRLNICCDLFNKLIQNINHILFNLTDTHTSLNIVNRFRHEIFNFDYYIINNHQLPNKRTFHHANQEQSSFCGLSRIFYPSKLSIMQIILNILNCKVLLHIRPIDIVQKANYRISFLFNFSKSTLPKSPCLKRLIRRPGEALLMEQAFNDQPEEPRASNLKSSGSKRSSLKKTLSFIETDLDSDHAYTSSPTYFI